RCVACSSCVPPSPAFGRTLPLAAFERGRKRIQPAFPHRTILADPRVQFPEALRSQRIQTPRAIGSDADEPRLLQDTEVPRHARLMDVHFRDEVVDCLFSLEQRLDDLEAARIRERLNRTDMHAHTYVYQRISCVKRAKWHCGRRSPDDAPARQSNGEMAETGGKR